MGARILFTAVAVLVWPWHDLGASGSMSATDAVRAAVVQRLGTGVDVSVASAGVSGDAQVFSEARPDPSGKLGAPMRFTLVTDRGAALPVTVKMTVIGDRVVASRAVARGEKLAADDLQSVRGEIADVPMRRLPTLTEVIGTRTLRPIAAGSTVLSSFVAVKRAIERGDHVVVRAAAGQIEVTAAMVAADGGDIGDVIRVANPDAKRYLRGRVVKPGLVEVIDER